MVVERDHAAVVGRVRHTAHTGRIAQPICAVTSSAGRYTTHRHT
jgi:hypothetical protein